VNTNVRVTKVRRVAWLHTPMQPGSLDVKQKSFGACTLLQRDERKFILPPESARGAYQPLHNRHN